MAARWRKMDNKTLTIAVLAMAVVGLAGATAYYQHQSTQTLEALQVNAPAQMDAKAQAAASGAEKNGYLHSELRMQIAKRYSSNIRQGLRYDVYGTNQETCRAASGGTRRAAKEVQR